ncbi:hypothetical protein VIBNISOn1_1600019 [Vibrio nigripulchritudo SOn1]|uniref:Uncharacterized protein n=1 Tax=Vibrio nigripulchritudo SOn1 TaxID=1238450 RepID=A0AAV2VMG4_9VIBR|nr:hypothetical protein VIBNISOn1_1600019 [Vibrio nigripulchritudo SOn1]
MAASAANPSRTTKPSTRFVISVMNARLCTLSTICPHKHICYDSQLFRANDGFVENAFASEVDEADVKVFFYRHCKNN